MRTVNVSAESRIAALLEEVAGGEEVIIAQSGKPIAKLIPFQPLVRRPAGLLEGQFTVPDDFDTAFDEEIWAGYEGNDTFPASSKAAE